MNTSRKAYQETLPKKRMGAGCLFFDEQGCILLVKPTYKPGWEIPGGVVEHNESPKQCCRREIQEELGIDRPIGDLLIVDYNPPTDEKTESLMFIFQGSILLTKDAQLIRLPADELSEFHFFKPEELPSDMTTTLRRRILAAIDISNNPKGIYLEGQEYV